MKLLITLSILSLLFVGCDQKKKKKNSSSAPVPSSTPADNSAEEATSSGSSSTSETTSTSETETATSEGVTSAFLDSVAKVARLKKNELGFVCQYSVQIKGAQYTNPVLVKFNDKKNDVFLRTIKVSSEGEVSTVAKTYKIKEGTDSISRLSAAALENDVIFAHANRNVYGNRSAEGERATLATYTLHFSMEVDSGNGELKVLSVDHVNETENQEVIATLTLCEVLKN